MPKIMNSHDDSLPISQDQSVTIHTDGACSGNPGPGGWAARLDWNGVVKTVSGGFRLTTNNRMELYAAIMALKMLTRSCSVNLYTDSRYVRDAVEKGWLTAWVKRGWKKADGKPALNKDLWMELQALLRNHQVTFHWVRGHAGHMENEEVDILARKAAQQKNLDVDSGFSAS